MKQTKEQLLIELEIVKKNNSEWKEFSNNIRKEFARAFSWNTGFGFGNTPTIPSWEEIFVEIGRLLAIRDYQNLKDMLKSREDELFYIKQKIEKENK